MDFETVSDALRLACGESQRLQTPGYQIEVSRYCHTVSERLFWQLMA